VSKNVKALDLNEWVDNFSTFMADEALKMLNAQGQKKGPEVQRALLFHFLARIITSSVYDALNDRGNLDSSASKKQVFEFTKKNFSDFKESLQDTIAMSFQTAFSHYAGRDMEYYCQIRPVPDPLSNKVN
jgi:hypothetical protein